MTGGGDVCGTDITAAAGTGGTVVVAVGVGAVRTCCCCCCIIDRFSVCILCCNIAAAFTCCRTLTPAAVDETGAGWDPVGLWAEVGCGMTVAWGGVAAAADLPFFDVDAGAVEVEAAAAESNFES